MTPPTYTLPQLARAIGAPYRTLHSWVERGILRPSVHRASGSGRANLFNAHDALTALVLLDLRDAGVKLELLERTARSLREQRDALQAPFYLLVNGDVQIVSDASLALRELTKKGVTVAYHTQPALDRVAALLGR